MMEKEEDTAQTPLSILKKLLNALQIFKEKFLKSNEDEEKKINFFEVLPLEIIYLILEKSISDVNNYKILKIRKIEVFPLRRVLKKSKYILESLLKDEHIRLKAVDLIVFCGITSEESKEKLNLYLKKGFLEIENFEENLNQAELKNLNTALYRKIGSFIACLLSILSTLMPIYFFANNDNRDQIMPYSVYAIALLFFCTTPLLITTFFCFADSRHDFRERFSIANYELPKLQNDFKREDLGKGKEKEEDESETSHLIPKDRNNLFGNSRLTFYGSPNNCLSTNNSDEQDLEKGLRKPDAEKTDSDVGSSSSHYGNRIN